MVKSSKTEPMWREWEIKKMSWKIIKVKVYQLCNFYDLQGTWVWKGPNKHVAQPHKSWWRWHVIYIEKDSNSQQEDFMCWSKQVATACIAVLGPLHVVYAHFSFVPNLGACSKKQQQQQRKLVLACWEHMSTPLSFEALL